MRTSSLPSKLTSLLPDYPLHYFKLNAKGILSLSEITKGRRKEVLKVLDQNTRAPYQLWDVKERDPKIIKKIFDPNTISMANRFSKKMRLEYDVVFYSGKFQISCHREILVKSCPYFKNLFEGGFQESRVNIIQIPKEMHAFRLLVSYIYQEEEEKLRLSYEGALDLYKLSCQFCYKKLTHYCQNFLIEGISPANFGQLLSLSKDYDDERLNVYLFMEMVQQPFAIMKLYDKSSVYYKLVHYFYLLVISCQSNKYF